MPFSSHNTIFYNSSDSKFKYEQCNLYMNYDNYEKVFYIDIVRVRVRSTCLQLRSIAFRSSQSKLLREAIISYDMEEAKKITKHLRLCSFKKNRKHQQKIRKIKRAL